MGKRRGMDTVAEGVQPPEGLDVQGTQASVSAFCCVPFGIINAQLVSPTACLAS
jgi:hypothetical protein